MTALDVTPWIGENTDSEELAAFKAKVIKAAELHSRRHHCGSIDEALKDLGIKKVKPIKVKFGTAIGLQMEVEIFPALLHNKDEEEQKKVLADKVGNLSVAGTGGTGSLAIAPEGITSMEIVTRVPPPPGTPVPIEVGVEDENGRMWAYVSREGRVVHLFRPPSQSSWDRGRRHAMCRNDTTTYNPETRDSTIAPENRVFCTTCLDRSRVDPEIRATLRENHVRR